MSSEHSFTGPTRGCLNFASSRSSTFAHTCPPKAQEKIKQNTRMSWCSRSGAA